MLKHLLPALLILAAGGSASAQYYGTTVFTEGFDGDVFPSEWQQVNATEGDATAWTVSDLDKPQFSAIDASSKHSAKISVNSTETKLSLTSPEIDATGKSGLQVGFYGNELSYAFRGGITFLFRASCDDGATWTDLFNSASSSYNGTAVGKWNLYKYTLPAEFDGKKIRLQFYIDATTAYNPPQGLPGYVDGVFLSLLPEYDPALSAINYSTNDRRPTEGVFGSAEPLKLTMLNAGTKPLAEAEFYYSVNGGAEKSEICTFPEAVNPGETYQYTFVQGIDLGTPRGEFVIRAGVRTDGDPITDNNELTAYVHNLLVTVPYVNPFETEEDGVKTTSKGGWTTFENNNEWGWDFEDWFGVYWYVEAEMNDDPNDAYLVSCPISLHKGESYRLEFSAVTEDMYDGRNILKVYVSPDKDMEEDIQELWSCDNVDEENCVGQSIIFTVPADGNYYLGFHSLSEPEAGLMRLEDIALYRNLDKDAAVVEVKSPVASAYTYTNAEKAVATIANYGSKELAAGAASVKLSIDGKTVLSESLAKALAPNAKTDFTFASPLDLSRLGPAHQIKVWVELEGDEDPLNDAVEFTLQSDVADAPYIADMGTATVKGSDVSRWEAVDSNGDGYAFTTRGDAALDSYAFSYGGGLYGFTTVTLPSSDDRLLSRHLRLTGGTQYKLSYCTRVGMDDAELPLEISLVKLADNSKAPVASTSVNYSDYREQTVVFTPEADGIYRLEFAVVTDQPIDYRLYLGKFRVTEQFDRDLSIEEILLPSRYISEIHSYPVGVAVRNNGTRTVDGFSLEATSESTGKVSRSFSGLNLEPDATYVVYFPDDFVFKGSDKETLSVALSCEGDEYEPNNAAEAVLTYIEPYSLPYNPMPETALAQMATFNLNRDSFAFNTDRSMGVGLTYVSDGQTEANDYLATPAMNLAADKPCRVSFSYYVLEGDHTDFEVFAYDAAHDVTAPVIEMNSASQTAMSRYIGFFNVPSDGAYSICFRPKGKAASLFVNASVSVEEATALPDLAIKGLLTHTEPAVLSDNERVEVAFTGNAEQGVQCVPFELEVGGKTYYSMFTRYTTLCSEGESYSVAFDDVDLSAPGEYAVKCRAIVPLDVKPEDNEAEFTIVSKAIVDVAVTAVTAPASGKLGHEETVTVTLANNGKGDLTAADLSCTVSSAAGSLTVSGKLAEAIPAGESAEFSFETPVDMFAEGVYTLTVTATAEGDVNPDDNTLTVQINSTAKDFDAGVSALVAPVDAAFGKAESVTVAVTNYGETDLFDVPVTVSVAYTGEEAAQTLNGTLAALPLGETVNFTLPGTVDLSRYGNYTLTAATAVTGDVDATNDALTTTLRCLTKDVGVSAIISPVSGEELGVCDVIVMVTNYGEADVESIPMEYQIGSMPQLSVMEGVLKAGESREYTFPVPYEFTSYRKATVRATTKLEGDANPDNDEMTADVENSKSGLDDVKLTVGVWPNPASEVVNVSVSAGIESVDVFDMNGRLVASFAGDGSQSLQFHPALAAGQYTLRVTTADGSYTTARLILL